MRFRYGMRAGRVSVREFLAIQQEIHEAKKARQTEKIKTIEGYSKKVIFSYSTKNLTKNEKVRLFYILKGRGTKIGMLEACNGVHLGPGVVMMPKRHALVMEGLLSEFLAQYDKQEIWIEQTSRKMKIREAFENRSVI